MPVSYTHLDVYKRQVLDKLDYLQKRRMKIIAKFPELKHDFDFHFLNMLIIPVSYTHLQCLESILEQTYRDLEIILVDDGSTDASGDICEQYAQYDNRIIVIHQKNSGAASEMCIRDRNYTDL